MRYWLFLGVYFWHASFAIADTLSAKIEQLIAARLPHATVAVLVKDASNEQSLYSRNADKLLMPASTTKLFTAAAALYELSPEFRFHTTLAKKEDNLYLLFSGSPSLTSTNLESLLMQLKKHNINTVIGDFIIDATHFKQPYYASGLSFDDLGWYYAAPDTAAILDENALDFEFTSAKYLGGKVSVHPKKANEVIPLQTNIITVDAKEAKEHCNLNITIDRNNQLSLYGCLSQTKQPRLMRLAVTDPLARAKSLITAVLKKHNIQVKGRILLAKAPRDAQVLAQLRSKELPSLLAHMLKESDNLYANSLTKELGAKMTGEGSYKQGAYAIQSVLKKNTNLDMSQVVIIDGMGTRYNMISADQIVNLLDALYHHEKFQPIIIAALPQSAVSGTLKDRMKKSPLAKLVFAKTGTMHDVSSLSGYLIEANKPPLLFAILINGINAPITQAKLLEDEILTAVQEQMHAMN